MRPLLDVLQKTTAFLKERGIESARLDAELLVGHVLGLDRVKVYLNFDRPFSEDELERLRPLLRRRAAREPMAWILGEKEFYGHAFVVKPGTLVPRPDTETLIEAFLEWEPAKAPEGAAPGAEAGAEAAGEPDPVYVVDVGSGSGCIGLTLALENPAVRLFAVDLSEDALACTKANVDKHGLGGRVAVLRGDGLAPVPASRPVDWIVANPPYIPSADIEGLAPEVRDWEPRLALDGGPDGLEPYRRLIPAAAARARRGVMVEVGAGQAGAVADLMRAAGLVDVGTKSDLGGVERVVRGRKA